MAPDAKMQAERLQQIRKQLQDIEAELDALINKPVKIQKNKKNHAYG